MSSVRYRTKNEQVTGHDRSNISAPTLTALHKKLMFFSELI